MFKTILIIMYSKILITGPPRCGKSTLIKKLISYYKSKNFIIEGFLTPEVQKEGKRIGFDIEDIQSGELSILARNGVYNTKYRLGSYSIFIKEFDSYLKDLKSRNLQNIDLLIIDEIGKMELYSQLFLSFLKQMFNSKIKILATIGQKLKHPIKNELLDLSGIKLIQINLNSQQEMFEKILDLI